HGDNFFTQQGAATAFDEIQFRVELVGAIDRQIKLGQSVDRGERNGIERGLRAGALGGGHADHIQAFSHARAEERDKLRRRRAGPKTKPHAGGHELQGFRSGKPLGVFKVWLWHGKTRWLRRGRQGLVLCKPPRQPRATGWRPRRASLYLGQMEVQTWLRLRQMLFWTSQRRTSGFPPRTERLMRSPMWRAKTAR